jgi:flagellar basal-body rod modification protein FlgD
MQIHSTTTATSASQAGLDMTSLSSQVLSQGDFLKLLVAQMTAQDPLNPLNNQDLLTQMVQFSTLQQNTNLQSALTGMQTSQDLTQANALLGRQVAVLADTNTLVQGVVTGVALDSGTPKVLVNGTAYNLSQVLVISDPASNP